MIKLMIVFVVALLQFYIVASAIERPSSSESLVNNFDSTLDPIKYVKPNIVWFVSEDNSPLLGAYGNKLVNTPALDKLASEGLLFSNAFSNAPVCAPSRAGIITGVMPTTTGSQHMRSSVSIDENIKFFPRYLKEAGYFTTLRLKRDYNMPNQPGTWDLDKWWSVKDAFIGRNKNQPFFMFYNTWMTHEGKLHQSRDKRFNNFNNTFELLDEKKLADLREQVLTIDPQQVELSKYQPDLPEIKEDIASYYELMQMMDIEFEHVLKDVEKYGGDPENTIIIYSSDHGGVLARSKRFTFDSGLKIPLIIRLPKKYQHLAPQKMGTTNSQLVTLLDIAPTILTLAGIETPAHMQGTSVISLDSMNKSQYAYGFRGRMDESYDMTRTVRDKHYRYIRNYNPHRPAAQHIDYLWKANNMRALEKAYLSGELTSTQAAFFTSKPSEELYNIHKDPDNVLNLINDPSYSQVLKRMRAANEDYIRKIKDVGFIPEGELYEKSLELNTTYQNYTATQPLMAVISSAEQMTNLPNMIKIKAYLKSEVPSIRFWGAMGALITKQSDPELINALKITLNDQSQDVAVIAAEALFLKNEKKVAIAAFERFLTFQNPFALLRATNALEATKISTPLIKKRLTEIAARAKKGRYEYAIRKAEFLLSK